MHYLILTKLEYPTSVSLRVRGLTAHESQKLAERFTESKINFTNIEPNTMEVDLHGIEMVNLLAKDFGFSYRVVGMAMAMELSSLGGRSFQIEKVVWTLEQSGCYN